MRNATRQVDETPTIRPSDAKQPGDVVAALHSEIGASRERHEARRENEPKGRWLSPAPRRGTVRAHAHSVKFDIPTL